MSDIIKEKIKKLEEIIDDWNSSGVSASLSPWHCGMGHPGNKSRYQQTIDEIRYLKELLIHE